MRLLHLFAISAFFFTAPAKSQESTSFAIPDQFLTDAIERLSETIELGNSADLNAHAYFLKRASDRFEIVYGTKRWRAVRPVITKLLQQAESAATDPISKEKIKSYQSSLLEDE